MLMELTQYGGILMARREEGINGSCFLSIHWSILVLLYFVRKSSIYSGFIDKVYIIVTLFESLVSVIISPCLFLILYIFCFFPSFLAYVAFVLLIFSKSQLMTSLTFSTVIFLNFINFSSYLFLLFLQEFCKQKQYY